MFFKHNRKLITPRDLGIDENIFFLFQTSSPVLVVSMQLHHPLLQLTRLIGGKAEVADVVGAMVIMVVVAQLSLDGIGAQKGMCDERAWQAA